MILAVEQTEWTDGTKNGVYLLSDDRSKMFAFAPYGSNDLKYFKRPISIDIRGRKFQTLTTIEDKPEGVEVIGSKGDKYYVTEDGCTCPAFKFRGDCKHFKGVFK